MIPSPVAEAMQLPKWRSQLAEYPFASHFADVGGYQMHYIDEGQGRPILMVHGNPTWSFYYRNLVSAFAGENRALAIDHIGCGLSEKSHDLEYTLAQRIEHLANFVRELDLRDISLLVHDWGGAIGLGAALEDLDRYRDFVIFNTGAFPPPFFPLRIRVCRTPLLGKVALQGFNLFARAAIKQATEQAGGLAKPVKDGLLAPYDSWSNRRAIYEFVKDIPTRENQATWKKLAAIESGLTRLQDRPVKLIWGMKDWCFRPECLHRFQSAWPDAVSVEIPDAGHYVIEDAPEETLQAISRFLSQPQSTS